MPKLVDGLFVSISSGSGEIPAVNVPNAFNKITIRLERATSLRPLTWPDPNTKVNISLYVSYDGSEPSIFVAGATAQGGIHITRSGIELRETTLTTNLNPGTGRKIKLSYSIINGPLATRATIEVN